MTAPTIDARTRTPRPWLMLAVGVTAQAAGTVVTATPTFLIPLLHTQRGVPLVQAALLASAPNVGMVLALVAWGWAADRWGERRVLTSGLIVATLAMIGAAMVSGYIALGVLLVLAGIGIASTNAASGRVVVGWFPPERRGLAMGIRQTCQPLGIAVAALAVPALAAGGSVVPPIVFGAVIVAVSAALCALVIVDPPRPAPPAEGEAAPRSPYRSSLLWRIHLVSALLVVPQFTLSIFGLVWLVDAERWTPLAAGILVSVAQFAGALGRIAIGVLSDRVGSRLRPLRWVAFAGIGMMLLTAASGSVGWPVAVAVSYALATCVSVADNGLAFTSVAELAGPRWSGRALGAQNTGQFLAAAAVGPVVGALIVAFGYPISFALVAIAPAIATTLIPSSRVERDSLAA